MMKLFEDFKNLNMIDRSLLTGRRNSNISLKDASITPDSKIEVNKVNPHKFTTVMEILNQEDVAAIVVRCHNRQLLLVSKDHSLQRRYNTYNTYMGIMTPTAHQKYNYNYQYNQEFSTSSEASMKTAISRVVKKFYEVENPSARKQWDILIVYKDPNVSKTREDRKEANTDKVLVPGDRYYDDFIQSLQSEFRKRAKKYVDSKAVDAQNAEDIKSYLMGRIKLERFKYKGFMYRLYDESLRLKGGYLKYIIEESERPRPTDVPYFIYIGLGFRGLTPCITDIKTSDSRWGGYNDARALD